MKNLFRKKWIVAGVLVLVVGGGGVAFSVASKGAKGPKEDTVKVEQGPLEVVVSETGTIEPLTKVEIKSRVAGQLAELRVDVGDRVEKGQLLIKLDTTDMERERARAEADRDMMKARLSMLEAGARPEEIQEAKAQLEQAESAFLRAQAEYQRSQAALKAQTITLRDAESARNDYDGARAQRDAAKARLAKLKAGSRAEEILEARAQLSKAEVALRAAQDQLDYASIRSPMAGTVIKRGIEVGEMVSPGVSATAQGTSMLTVADLDRLILKSNLNQVDIGKVAKGLSVEVRVDSAPGKVFVGAIHKVAPAADGSQSGQNGLQTFPVETILKAAPGMPTELLKPGMTADLDIQVTRKADALYLPVEAVVRGKGNEATVTLPAKSKEAKPEVRTITLGLSNDHQIEVVEGLAKGDVVLIKPASSADNAAKF
ncbi:Macrolide export protein MacA [compost metagenome]